MPASPNTAIRTWKSLPFRNWDKRKSERGQEILLTPSPTTFPGHVPLPKIE
jgi:hypothetical protein